MLQAVNEKVAVALLAEGVDRNIQQEQGERYRLNVALLAEGVDRNLWWLS